MLSEIRRTPLKSSLDALEATHCAVSVFMQSSDFEGMLIQAVNMGGDTDTIGAICGALGGAFWGLDEIPKRWRLKLKHRRRIEKAAFALAKKAI
jgi:ADP-ribosyl-[dinitrogen reductase] hydrolase